jgi:hypothetical protein
VAGLLGPATAWLRTPQGSDEVALLGGKAGGSPGGTSSTMGTKAFAMKPSPAFRRAPIWTKIYEVFKYHKMYEFRKNGQVNQDQRKNVHEAVRTRR